MQDGHSNKILTFHKDQNSQSQHSPHSKHHKKRSHTGPAVKQERVLEYHSPQNLRQLCKRKGKYRQLSRVCNHPPPVSRPLITLKSTSPFPTFSRSRSKACSTLLAAFKRSISVQRSFPSARPQNACLRCFTGSVPKKKIVRWNRKNQHPLPEARDSSEAVLHIYIHFHFSILDHPSFLPNAKPIFQ